MGVLNLTPDSFSDGGLFLGKRKGVDHALRLADEGADIVDIGGESTRPGAVEVSLEEECRRVLPVIEALANKISIPISIDSRKSEVVRRAQEAGASIVNDVSGFSHDPKMFSLAARGNNGLIFMHAKGSPQTMQIAPRYENIMKEIYRHFGKQIRRASRSKISRNRIAIDPGIGFGKTAKHNLILLRRLHIFTALGLPILVGPSRKSFIGALLKLPPEDRMEGTAAAVAIAVFQGARILRVHDVKASRRVALVAEGIRREAICA